MRLMSRTHRRVAVTLLVSALSLLAVGVALPATIVGTAGADRLLGTGSADRLNGRAGNDRLFGRAGKDTLIGGAGHDMLNGGPGNDQLLARDGRADSVFCGAGPGDRAVVDKVDLVLDCETVRGQGDQSVEVPVEQPPPPAQPGTTRENPVPRGVTVTLGDGWQVRVDAVNPNATDAVLAENMFNDPPAPGKQFFIATLTATYSGAGSSRLDGSFRFRAVGASAVSYTTFNDSCGVIPNDMPDTEVFTGGTISGNICWQVTSGDASTLVMYDDPLLDAQRIYFALF
jgi:Ca2+-binding RTX toxin-like protein